MFLMKFGIVPATFESRGPFLKPCILCEGNNGSNPLRTFCRFNGEDNDVAARE